MKKHMQPSQTCLISGSTGFLGTHLVKAFLAEGFIVVGIKRENSSLARLNGLNKSKNLYLYDACYSNLKRAFQEHQIDAIIHTACCYGRKGENLSDIIQTNIQFGIQLLDLACNCDTRLFINTDTLLPINLNDYTLSKKQLTEWLKKYAGKIKIVNVKLEHMYGPGDGDAKFIGMLLAQLQKHASAIPLTTGVQKRDFVYITDVVSAYVTIYKNSYSLQNFTEFEVGSGKSIPVKTFVEEYTNQYKALDTYCKTELNFGAVPYRQNEPMSVFADISQLQKLGWQPQVDYITGIKQSICNIDCAMLIASWDGAEELWKPFSTALKKFWSDCPLPVYLLTETKTSELSIFTAVLSINEKYTSDRIYKALESIHTKYILLIPDDFFFNENVSTEKIISIIETMNNQKLDLIKFIQSNSNFAFSFTPCLIKREVLLCLAKAVPNAYARQFEVRASAMLNKTKNVKITSEPCRFTTHCVLEGYWNRKAYNWCKKNNIQLIFKTYKRPECMRSICKTVKTILFYIVLYCFPTVYKIYKRKKYE